MANKSETAIVQGLNDPITRRMLKQQMEAARVWRLSGNISEADKHSQNRGEIVQGLNDSETEEYLHIRK